jgi:succinate dehydrogenase/fumarate reductase flavoprotein subunit
MHADLLILGGGMAGLAAAARAAELGASVVIAEKRTSLGGSAALSAGIVWTAPDHATLREVVPSGDPVLGRILIDRFPKAVDWLRSLGIAVSEPWQGQFGFGTAVWADIPSLIATWTRLIEQAGSTVLRSAAARSLILADDGSVAGARLTRPGTGGEPTTGRGPTTAGETTTGGQPAEVLAAVTVSAPRVLLATGGFQGDRELLTGFLGPAAGTVLVRSNPGSTGDGFRLGRAAGAAASRCLGGFYGHLVPSPLRRFDPEDFLPLTQYQSRRSILVNKFGQRFTDESLGDEVSNQETLRQPAARAFLICDDTVRQQDGVSAPYPHGTPVDRFAAAARAGARIGQAPTMEQLVDLVGDWGVNRRALLATLTECQAGGGPAAGPPLPAGASPLRVAPFHAMEVQPTCTFPFGGLAVDEACRVLDRDGSPVGGLFAAGADAGGLQDFRYVAGLALGLVFGPWAAENALTGP